MTGRGAGVTTGHEELRAAVSLWQDVDYLMDTTKTPRDMRHVLEITGTDQKPCWQPVTTKSVAGFLLIVRQSSFLTACKGSEQ